MSISVIVRWILSLALIGIMTHEVHWSVGVFALLTMVRGEIEDNLRQRGKR